MNEFERRKRDAETVEAVPVEPQSGDRYGQHADGGTSGRGADAADAHDGYDANDYGGRARRPEFFKEAEEAERRLGVLSHVLYGLYAVSWFTAGLSSVVALIIDYVRRNDARGTIYATHATWRIRTFWFSLLWTVLSAPFIPIHIGFWMLGIVNIWMLYRIARGWLRLFDKKPV